MGKKKKPAAEPEPFAMRTEACPRMRRRWRRENAPEILAWLFMVRARLVKAKEAEDVRRRAYPALDTTGEHSALAHRIRLMNELASVIWDQWSEYEWNESMTEAVAAIHAAQACGLRDRTIDAMFPAPKPLLPRAKVEETAEWHSPKE